MSLYFKTRLFAKKKGAVGRLVEKAKIKGAKVSASANAKGRSLYKSLEDKQKHAGIAGLTGIGALAGGGIGAGVAGISLRGLKGRLREANPQWSDEKVQAEYDKIKKKRLAIGAALGAVAGGGLGYMKGREYKKTYTPNAMDFYNKKK